MHNRGRFQAQGQNVEESESWAQEEPLYSDQAKIKLINLRGKLSSVERNRRENAFIQCESFIVRACENGGILVVDKALRKSFPGTNRERIDVEVWKGEAFIRKDGETC